MRAWTRPFLGVVIGVAGCSSSGKQSATSNQTSKAVAEALTTGVDFENGKVKTGALPAATASKVMVQPSTETLTLQPSGASIMTLDVDNPDESTDPVAATLIQFADTDSHVEVARSKSDAGSGDAGSSTGASGIVKLMNPFTLGADVCKNFCTTTFPVKMFMAVTLKSGKISQHSSRTFTLDCVKDGDDKKCDKDAGTKKGTAGKPSTVADAGKRDASVDLNAPEEKLGAAYAGFDKAVCGCSSVPDKASAYCSAAPISQATVDCIKAQVKTNIGMACVSAKVTCDIKAINAVATTCMSCGGACTTDPNQMLGAALAAETGAGCSFKLPGIDTCKLNLGDAGTPKDSGTPGGTDAGAKDAGPCGP